MTELIVAIGAVALLAFAAATLIHARQVRGLRRTVGSLIAQRAAFKYELVELLANAMAEERQLEAVRRGPKLTD